MMTAVRLESPGGPLVIRSVPVPLPGPGEVLVKIAAAPVNPSDLARIKKVSSEEDALNFSPGIEGSGTVVAAGTGILPKLWMKKRVACSSASSASGTWAEFMVTSASMCFPISKKIPEEQVAMTLVNPLTALAFFDIILKYKHKAIINTAAASALGRIIELLGNIHHVPVINIVHNQNQLDGLRASGSGYVLNSSDILFLNSLNELANKLNATLLLDAVGGNQLYDMIDAMPYASSVVLYGNLSGDAQIAFNPATLIAKNIKISGFYLANAAKENSLVKNILNVRQVNQLFKSGLRINIRNKFPLNKVQEAIDYYRTDMSAGKVLLIPIVK